MYPLLAELSAHDLEVAETLIGVIRFLLIFLAARALAEVLVRLSLPTIVGELLAGVVIGASGFHLLIPPSAGTELNEGLVNVVQQYVKKGANVYVEGQLSTRKWKDESTGQDKYSTEIVLQGYNSSLTMLDGKGKTTTPNNNESKSSLPNDQISQDSSDLDDEIPF